MMHLKIQDNLTHQNQCVKKSIQEQNEKQIVTVCEILGTLHTV